MTVIKPKDKINKSTCLARLAAGLLLLLVAGFTALRLYAGWLTSQAEARYPPAEFVDVGGVRLHYASKGSGRAVVFVGGRNSKTQDFTLSPLFDPITAKYRATFIDRPGLGYSEPIAGEDATPAAQARCLHAALQQLGITKPVMVGQSWGGVIVLAYALDYPGDLAGVVLLGSAPYPREMSPDPLFATIESIVRLPILGDLFLLLYTPVARQLAPRFLQAEVEYFAPLEAVPSSYAGTTIYIALRPEVIKADAQERRFVAAGLEAVSRRLARVSAPVVIVAGSLDAEAVEQAPRLSRDIPNSRMMVAQGANHYFWYANPGVVIEAIQQAWELADQLGTSR